MKLSAAAKHFDQQVLTDAYGTATVLGQFDLFDDNKRDSAAAGRRILSVAPDVTMPARNVLRLGDHVWIVGNARPDFFKASVIRNKFVLHETDGLASIQTFAQLLAATVGLSAYAAVEWVKTTKEVDESSELIDVLQAVFARSEALPPLGVITLNGGAYLLREPHLSSAGFLSAYVDEIKAPVTETGTFSVRTYDPVADTSTGTNLSVKFLRLRWQSHFKYLSERTLTYQAGDDVLICLKTAVTPKANDKITLADGVWLVIGVQSEDTCWRLHVRSVSG